MVVRVKLLVDLVATFVCTIAMVLILAGLSSPVRPYLVLAGLVLGTGWSLTGWVKLPDEAAYIGSFVLAIGLAVPIGFAVLLVESGWWHPLGDAAALLALAGLLNLLQCLRDARVVIGE